jgi:ABC-type antimicrobial peptide transport system permease subunit
MNTLTYGVTTLTLPDDLLWVDEFDWQQVQQGTAYTVAGALLVEAAVKLAGRPVTLQAGVDYAWTLRSVLNTLNAWKALPAQVFALVLRDAAPINVVFDHARTPIEARPVIDYATPVDDDPYVVTLRFIKV